MSVRKLPIVSIAQRPKNIQSEVSQAALDRWDRNIQAAAGSDNSVISIMDYIGQDFFGTGVTANRVAGALRAIGNKPVTVEINSPGGDYFEGLAIYNVLREHSKDVIVKVLGMAASAASIVAMAGDEIMVARAGFIMIHNVWSVVVGDKGDMREAADFLEPLDAVMADLYSARSGISTKEIAKMLDAETWIGGSDAVDMGMADSLLPSDEVTTKAKNELARGPIAAMRRIDAALAKGEQLPRSERRQLFKEFTGTPSAAEDGTPSAANDAVSDDGSSRLRLALARLKMAGIS